MNIVRADKTDNYTIISNYPFRDKRLSFRALGLLAQILSLPDDWEFSAQGLAKIHKDKAAAVYSMLKELETAGYLTKQRVRNSKGQYTTTEYVIHEKPILKKPLAESPYMEKPHMAKPSCGNPSVENQAQLNTNNNKINNNNKKKESTTISYDEILCDIEDDGLKELYLEYIKMRKLIKAPMTSRALTMLIKKVTDLEPVSIERQKQMLETAIMNNWKSVYPLKEGQTTKQEITTKKRGGTYL